MTAKYSVMKVHTVKSLIIFMLLVLVSKGCYSIKWITMKYNKRHHWVTKDCTFPAFNKKITRFCYKNLELMNYVIYSSHETVRECKQVFQNRRWDCTSIDKAPKFDVDLREDTRESAFVHALFSSALVHTIARACLLGFIKYCQCSKKLAPLPLSNNLEDARFSKCSDFIGKGMIYSKKFTDTVWKRKKKSKLSNRIKLHNSKTGREVVRSLQTIECRCHGLSGSCTVRNCWRRIPLLSDVIQALVTKYDNALKVIYDKTQGFRPQWRNIEYVTYKELIYRFDSPTYCERDKDLGTSGTRGRECNRTSNGIDGCDRLCCGRGYTVKTIEVEERCRCKYYWCCYVKCKQCRRKKDIAICK